MLRPFYVRRTELFYAIKQKVFRAKMRLRKEIYYERKAAKIREEAVRQIEEAKELNALNDVRVSVLGKKES